MDMRTVQKLRHEARVEIEALSAVGLDICAARALAQLGWEHENIWLVNLRVVFVYFLDEHTVAKFAINFDQVGWPASKGLEGVTWL